MTAISPNYALLDANRPEVARLIAAMVQARDAVEHRSYGPELEGLDNVLLQNTASVPGPIAGAGLPGLLASGGPSRLAATATAIRLN
jgi:hypothetical protein